MIRIYEVGDLEFEDYLDKILRRGDNTPLEIVDKVEEIIEDVINDSDRALISYTEKFDGIHLDSKGIEITRDEINDSAKKLTDAERETIERAAERIRKYHLNQTTEGFDFKDEHGNRLRQLVRPLRRVGVYVPGGTAPYPSTLLMSVIPARIAGVNEVVAVHPTPQGRLSPAVMAAAEISGIDRIYRVGGVQAIAALAFGTETIPNVDKIVGPGNIYVNIAKVILFGAGVVDIDMIAGPSEILVIADGGGDPAFAAADLLSQAEHDPLSASILLTQDRGFAVSVKEELKKQLGKLDRRKIASESLRNYGAIIVVEDIDEAISISNKIAPEHLELMVKDPEKLINKVTNAGSIFMGHYTPETIGDYVAGPNHILPTGGTARFMSPLSVYDFVKRMSVIEMSKEGFSSLGPLARDFAMIEGFSAHAGAVDVRLEKKK